MNFRFLSFVILLLVIVTPAFSADITLPAWAVGQYDYFPIQIYNSTTVDYTVSSQADRAAWALQVCNSTNYDNGYSITGGCTGGSFCAGSISYGYKEYAGNIHLYQPQTYPYQSIQYVCNGAYHSAALAIREDYLPNMTVDFVGSPLLAIAPHIISLNDTSSYVIGPAVYNWSITPETGAFFSHSDTKNTTVYISNAGNYTISHGVSTPYNNGIANKTDYLYVYNDSSTATTGCLAINGANGMRIGGAQVDLYDIENNTWTNTTTTEGLGMITTLKGHTINCYGSATGFSDNDLLNQPEKDLGFYTLNLWPSAGYRNVSAGYVTLYITVTELDTGNPIAGAMVSGGGNNYGVSMNSSAFSLVTNAQGMASVPVPNNSVIYLTSYKSGYNTQTGAVNTGTGSGGDAKVSHWFKMSKTTINPTAKITTLPSGGYPTTSRTIDPAGTPDPAGGSSGYSSAKGQQMMDFLATNGMDLVQLCFIVTVMALLGVKFGK